MTVLALALASWVVSGPSAFAHGGGGGGGGGHGGGGGGHGGGGHSGGGHSGGGYHSGGSYHGGGGYHGGGVYHHGGNGYYGGYYPYYFGSGYYGGLGYGYGYGYGSGYNDPYYSYGPTYSGYSYPAYDYAASGAPALTAATGVTYPGPAQGRYLGIDEQPVNDSAGPGMKVVQVYPGSAAQQAGLEPGDVVLSANGYVTQQPGHLAWIISTVAPERLAAVDGSQGPRRRGSHRESLSSLILPNFVSKPGRALELPATQRTLALSRTSVIMQGPGVEFALEPLARRPMRPRHLLVLLAVFVVSSMSAGLAQTGAKLHEIDGFMAKGLFSELDPELMRRRLSLAGTGKGRLDRPAG